MLWKGNQETGSMSPKHWRSLEKKLKCDQIWRRLFLGIVYEFNLPLELWRHHTSQWKCNKQLAVLMIIRLEISRSQSNIESLHTLWAAAWSCAFCSATFLFRCTLADKTLGCDTGSPTRKGQLWLRWQPWPGQVGDGGVVLPHGHGEGAEVLLLLWNHPRVLSCRLSSASHGWELGLPWISRELRLTGASWKWSSLPAVETRLILWRIIGETERTGPGGTSS